MSKQAKSSAEMQKEHLKKTVWGIVAGVALATLAVFLAQGTPTRSK